MMSKLKSLFNLNIAFITCSLLLLQIMVVILSWMIKTIYPEFNGRSLLSGEGVRWFLGNFTNNVASNILVWIILIGLSWGAIRASNILQVFKRSHTLSYRERLGFRVVLIEIMIWVIVIVLLSFIPHAAMLSITGQLFPSSFSKSIVPLIAFIALFSSITYGLIIGRLRKGNLIIEALSNGIKQIAPYIIIYIILVQLIYSIKFVLLI
ncbi:AbgT family transporter [Hoylesella nanceiensis]|uniref:AbgT family transporter n=1 Tax=Hoylesella nanceiensis TaxID=425941 RepID=UPI00241CE995|nr:AbgT family transporter [Hoylesella nanceiensis]